MTPETLWTPTVRRLETSTMYNYMQWVNMNEKQDCATYNELHKWSVENEGEFWRTMIDYFGVEYEGSRSPAYNEMSFLNYSWFPNVRLNFAQNLQDRVNEKIMKGRALSSPAAVMMAVPC